MLVQQVGLIFWHLNIPTFYAEKRDIICVDFAEMPIVTVLGSPMRSKFADRKRNPISKYDVLKTFA